jgi:uncharacterized membrane protein
MIGWCMVLMAVLVRLPVAVVGVFGLVIIAGHNLLDGQVGGILEGLATNPLSGLWKVLYLAFFAPPVQLGANGPPLMVLYSLIPWIGVMAAGYAFGSLIATDAARRRRACLTIGLGAIGLFLVLRGFNLYGDPNPWSVPSGPSPDGRPPMPALFSFLNTNKYPASLDFLLMTLGPTIALLPLLENASGVVARWLTVFGRVPFFFYLLHIPLIHLLALIVSKVRLGEVSPWLFANHPMGSGPAPDGYRWSLPLLYLVWAVSVLILYWVCRWYEVLRTRRKAWWLGYL